MTLSDPNWIADLMVLILSVCVYKRMHAHAITERCEYCTLSSCPFYKWTRTSLCNGSKGRIQSPWIEARYCRPPHHTHTHTRHTTVTSSSSHHIHKDDTRKHLQIILCFPSYQQISVGIYVDGNKTTHKKKKRKKKKRTPFTALKSNTSIKYTA